VIKAFAGQPDVAPERNRKKERERESKGDTRRVALVLDLLQVSRAEQL